MKKEKKPKVLIIGLGGTISSTFEKGKINFGEITQNRLLEMITSVSNIEKNYQIETTNLLRINSSEMNPSHWLTLANTIYYNLKKFDGIVITMGTDTLTYTSSAISFLIQDIDRPIVFTGSNIDSTQVITDGRRNLREAIMVAGESKLKEVVIVANEKIHRAVQTKRTNASEFELFSSPKLLGKVQRFIKLNNECGKQKRKKKLNFYNNIETNVSIIKVYPGFNGNIIKTEISNGTKGIILEGYGLGTLPTANKDNLKDALKEAEREKIPLIVTSECRLGDFWENISKADVGDQYEKFKIIPAYDMLTETAFVKLMWVLGQTNKYSEVKKMMQKNYVGEITENPLKNVKVIE